MIVRKAEGADAQGIFDVETESFSVPWSLQAITRELANPNLTMYYVLADEDGTIAGYAGLWRVLDEGQITNIALKQQYRRQGYGELLLRVLMEAAWEDGCSDIFLEVRVSNIGALHLYRKLGYQVLSVRKNYYSEPEEDFNVVRFRRAVRSGSWRTISSVCCRTVRRFSAISRSSSRSTVTPPACRRRQWPIWSAACYVRAMTARWPATRSGCR